MAENKNNYICPACGHAFVNNYNLERHLNGKRKCHKPFQCIRCEKIFKLKRDMDRHQARKYQCVDTSHLVVVAAQPLLYPELKARELDIEEKKIELEEKKLDIMRELKYAELNNSLLIEKEKTARKQTTSKTVNINNTNNIYIVNCKEIPIEIIDTLTEEISKQLIENDNMGKNVMSYLHNNDNFPMHKNMMVVDEPREIFKYFFEGEWRQISDYNVIGHIMNEHTKEARSKIFQLYLVNSKVDDIEKNKRIDIFNKQSQTLSNIHDDYKTTLISALPKGAQI